MLSEIGPDDERGALDEVEQAYDGPIWGSAEPVDGKCGARLRRRPGIDQRYCVRNPMRNGRCYRHGGASLSGLAAPGYKHGRYSQSIPARLAERYEQAQGDAKLLGFRDDIGLVDARLADLLERSDSGESGAAWATVRKLWADFRRYRASGDVKNMQATLESLDEPLAKGLADHAAWAEIGQLLDRRARLVEAERRRLEQIEQVITVEEVMGLLGTVVDVIRRNVTDARTLDRIGAELGSLVAVDAVPLAARSRRSGRRR